LAVTARRGPAEKRTSGLFPHQTLQLGPSTSRIVKKPPGREKEERVGLSPPSLGSEGKREGEKKKGARGGVNSRIGKQNHRKQLLPKIKNCQSWGRRKRGQRCPDHFLRSVGKRNKRGTFETITRNKKWRRKKKYLLKANSKNSNTRGEKRKKLP